jgi:ABC-2 type transport system ATP-binding protein
VLLELQHVGKLFSGIPAVEDVSFVARSGEVTGYLGPNASGKSTTLKMIAGLIAPSNGGILFGGEGIQRDLIKYKQRLGYVPEEPHIYSHLTGLEYLMMVAQIARSSAKIVRGEDQGPLAVVLVVSRPAPARVFLSKGMHQKVLLSAALLHTSRSDFVG